MITMLMYGWLWAQFRFEWGECPSTVRSLLDCRDDAAPQVHSFNFFDHGLAASAACASASTVTGRCAGGVRNLAQRKRFMGKPLHHPRRGPRWRRRPAGVSPAVTSDPYCAAGAEPLISPARKRGEV